MTQELHPHKVTKPIQLLAAWLLGLIAIEGAFLTGARLIVTPTWAPGVLVVAAVLCVPLFLFCIFLLQTRFRPEMQEDSYYSQYLAVEQQTRKIASTSTDQVVQLRDMLLESQAALSGGLRALDAGMAELQSRLPGAGSTNDETASEVLVERSEQILAEARSQLLPPQINIQLNDLLPMYEELRRKWRNSRITVTSTFGSTSIKPSAPVFLVVSIARGVAPDAMYEVCKSLITTGDWYVEYAPSPDNFGNIYVGSYGYGGNSVSRLTGDLLQEMSLPGFSLSQLQQWIVEHSIRLDADYADER